ncbi:MAG TPA: pantoate--beta-alanine ligase [Chitinophagaceae bacterium]|jgi:pantoate--beta-alanine ligase|nr:pantoate--beta-alanine ligase [Chitinophagaceae bacterium]
MIVFKKALDLQNHLNNWRMQNEMIGFVPTMGALHEGHLSLLMASKSENKVTVCSIFVNPAQFNDPKDFEKYPSTLEQDIYKLEATGCDILFLPPVNEIYEEAIPKKKDYDLGYLDTILEGKYRPGHFNGVCMAVEKLLAIVLPDNLYLGQKDYQQCMIIKRLIQLMGLEEKIQIKICPILREKDGLAMSSRNTRLNNEQRAKATALYETLIFLKQNLNKGSLSDLKKEATTLLQQKSFKADYVEIADAKTLKPINEWDSRTNIIGVVAAYIDGVRLIDNMMLN